MKKITELLCFSILVSHLELAVSDEEMVNREDFQSYVESGYFAVIYAFEDIKTVLDIVDYIAPGTDVALAYCKNASEVDFQGCLARKLSELSCSTHESGSVSCRAENLFLGMKNWLNQKNEAHQAKAFMVYVPGSLARKSMISIGAFDNVTDFIGYGAEESNAFSREHVNSQQVLRWFAVSLLKAFEKVSRNVALYELDNYLTGQMAWRLNNLEGERLQQFQSYLEHIFSPEGAADYQKAYTYSYELIQTGLYRRQLQRDWMLTFASGVLTFQITSLTCLVCNANKGD